MSFYKRSAKILGAWVMGYSGGIGLIFPLSVNMSLDVDITTMLVYPVISGFVVALPQLAKGLIEFGDS